MASHNFNPEIIREYDIRGIYGQTLDEVDAYYIGRAFGTMIAQQEGTTVCVGLDGRQSSPVLERELIRGLSECGLTVERIGLGPTPLLYFAVKDHLADGGIMVTGSHNPGHMNGFKMTFQRKTLYGKDIKDLAAIAEKGEFVNGRGTEREVSMQETYVERLLRDMNISKSMKIAWDAGNGAAGAVLHQLVSKLPGEHVLLYDNIDGNFPNHHPDPTVDENLKDLQKVVREQGCDLGIAFDGDADRVGVVDNRGDIIRCDILMAIFAKDVLKDLPGAPIIADVKCSDSLFSEVKRLGGEAVMWKTGHSLIKSKMFELNAPLAGELSGHIFFADKYYGYDDGLYAAVRLLHILSAPEEYIYLSDMLSDLPRPINTPEMRIEVPESEKFQLIERVRSYLEESLADAKKIDATDGVRITLDQGWWLLRASNTQAAIVARAEATSKEDLEVVKKNLQSSLKKAGTDIDLDLLPPIREAS